MRIINKIKISQAGYKTTKVSIAGIVIWSDKRSFLWRKLKVFGIPLLSYKNKLSIYKKERFFEDISVFFDFANEKCFSSNKKTMLWIDHFLGGGTETYSFNQFSELQKEFVLLRLQYNSIYDVYILSIPSEAVVYVSNCDIIKTFISKYNFFEICVNSIVAWSKPLELLTYLSNYKENHPQTKVSFRGHDFHAICPSYNLLNCDNVFCNLSYYKGCSYCIRNVKLTDDKNNNKILLKDIDVNNIDSWKKSWNDFFHNTCDEMIVFSNSTKELYIRAYPTLKTKIRIIPHKTKQLPVVEVGKHEDINIAMLGNITSVAKGSDIIRKMCKINKDSHLNLIVIGTYKKATNGLVVTGKYKPVDIPKLIKKHNIDIVFIPSVWPETFSYTTSEAMSMNIPVACYDMGAPAERISKYEKGLVLKDINPLKNLQEIKNFVEQLRMETK